MPPKTKIFVGKLPNECSEPSLQKLFERHGEVTECSVLGNFGFVHMKTEDQALEAIRALNNYQFEGTSISVEQSTGEKRDSGYRPSYRGGRGGRGGGGPMRPGGRGGMRPGPYDRMHVDRYGGPPPPPMSDRYGPLPPPPMSRSSYYDDYERRDPLRRPLPPGPLPLERRPLPPPSMGRDPYLRDPYDRYDAYDRLGGLPPRRSPPMLDRRIPPMDYERRPHPYADLYRERDPYASRDPYGGRRSISPRRYAGPPRDLPPPRRF